jgi:hypothetical protein
MNEIFLVEGEFLINSIGLIIVEAMNGRIGKLNTVFNMTKIWPRSYLPVNPGRDLRPESKA